MDTPVDTVDRVNRELASEQRRRLIPPRAPTNHPEVDFTDNDNFVRDGGDEFVEPGVSGVGSGTARVPRRPATNGARTWVILF